jgi:hypothetical protein
MLCTKTVCRKKLNYYKRKKMLLKMKYKNLKRTKMREKQKLKDLQNIWKLLRSDSKKQKKKD